MSGVARPWGVTRFNARVDWSSASKSVQSIATRIVVSLPTTSFTHSSNISQTTIFLLLKSRSTCLTVCFVVSLLACARDCPMMETASETLVITPIVASASDLIRLAWTLSSSTFVR